MIDFPNAKINLGLKVLNKRPDGYHTIDSIFAPISLTDILEFHPSSSPSFSSSGISIPSSNEGNLVLQAYQLIKNDFDIPPLDIRLKKVIPIGAGLGGGSADASFMLKMLNNYFSLNISNLKLEEYATKLGADCPFFIENKTSYVEGIGEKMTPVNINLNNYHVVLVNPRIHISTREAYSMVNLSGNITQTTHLITNNYEPYEWSKQGLSNDFESAIFKKHPKMQLIKNELEDAGGLYVSMTGSGSTVYGIFKEKPTFSTSAESDLFFCKFL